jgi:opacity protein-like surface antigen
MRAINTVRGLLFAAGAALSLQAIAGAQEGAYIGGGITEANIDFGGSDVEPTALFARIGYQINDIFAVEGRIGTGFDDDKGVDIDEMLGIYGKAGIPTSVGLYPYVMLGLTSGEISAGRYSEDDSDISYGIGVDYWVTSQFSVGLEYMDYMDVDGADITGITLGANYRF